jgi:hypothetical protein
MTVREFGSMVTRTIVTIPMDDKKWLESYSHRRGVSSAEIIRLAIKEYRGKVSQGGLQRVLRETAGKWTSLSGDSQEHVDALRTEWERRS